MLTRYDDHTEKPNSADGTVNKVDLNPHPDPDWSCTHARHPFTCHPFTLSPVHPFTLSHFNPFALSHAKIPFPGLGADNENENKIGGGQDPDGDEAGGTPPPGTVKKNPRVKIST